jgi:hypothetical protein
MSHHYSGPDYGFPHGDARLDLTDLYAFPKPGEAGKSILIMDVHPSAGVNPPGPTIAEPFSPDAIYEFKIDAGETILEGAPVSTGAEARVTAAGDHRLFAGWRSDPFFFDTAGCVERHALHRQ